MEAAYEWYSDRSSQAARRFRIALRSGLARTGSAPNRQVEILPGIRRVLLDKFPFQVIYQVRQDVVLVVALAHLKREGEGEYWLSRLPEQPMGPK